ncbi:MAG: site-specific integrase, partial [Ignavibacteria bacterium]|nr:site-specific integrase [Ignavibacteria bacterium]
VFVEWDYTPLNPFQKIKLPKRQKEEPKGFTNDELILIKNRLTQKGKAVISDMVEFSVNTGLRGGEIVNLRWTDINFKERKLNVGSKHHKTKSRKIRIVPFNDIIENILIANTQRQMKNGKIIREFVFTQKSGKPYQIDTISKQLKKVIRELGLSEELHWHSLRATAASNWVNKKVPIYTVQKLLGHANVSTTQIYAKVDLEELRDAVNRL